jgi:hypothetical protein
MVAAGLARSTHTTIERKARAFIRTPVKVENVCLV